MLSFYNIIFTTAFKIVQIVASFSQFTDPQILQRTARYMAEASLPLFPLPIVPRALTSPISPPVPPPPPLRRRLCRGERFGPENVLVGLGEQ